LELPWLRQRYVLALLSISILGLLSLVPRITRLVHMNFLYHLSTWRLIVQCTTNEEEGGQGEIGG
jgi:hypothetical protein